MFGLLIAVIYLSFISLGLPDALLGAAWPSIYPNFDVPVSYSGIIACTISLGTVVSSLQSSRVIRKLGTCWVTAISVGMTAISLLGFSLSSSFWMLLLWAIPYGLGAGSVDAALNNYAAVHFESRHMSWLHCMWGLGASIGPYIMGFVLTKDLGWDMGYRIIGIMQVFLTLVIIFSRPLWKSAKGDAKEEKRVEALTLKKVFSIPGVKALLLSFFCYCSLEGTAGLWASSYLVLYKGITAERAAFFASLFYMGITVGRGISGFITYKLNDRQMIIMGLSIIAVGIIALLLPLGDIVSLLGLVIIGLGCAPIYPCIIHSTPLYFGEERSQSIIGVQMACAYIGSCTMPPLFGLLGRHITFALYPFYLLVFLVVMSYMQVVLKKKTQVIACHV